MDDINKSLSYAFAHSGEGEIQNVDTKTLASLMIQTNALISVRTAVQLCSLSLKDINYRIREGRFPQPLNLSLDDQVYTQAFRIRDIQKWLKNPSEYYIRQPETANGGFKVGYD